MATPTEMSVPADRGVATTAREGLARAPQLDAGRCGDPDVAARVEVRGCVCVSGGDALGTDGGAGVEGNPLRGRAIGEVGDHGALGEVGEQVAAGGDGIAS